MSKVLIIIAIVLIIAVVVFGIISLPNNRDFDDGAPNNAAAPTAMPWFDSACWYRTIVQAQGDVPFSIIYLQPQPGDFVFDSVPADPPYETPVDCESVKTITA